MRTVFGTNSSIPAPVRILLFANIGLFLVDYLTRGTLLFPWFALFPSAVIQDFQVWRLFTYMFLHDYNGILHIAFNMLMLWMFGAPVAREMGDRGFLQLYLLSGVFAGVCSLLFYGAGNPTAVVGASGAIFALLIAFARFHPDQQLLMFFLFPVPVRYAVLIFVVISLLMLRANDGVAHIAHLGGALFGWVYLKWFWSPSQGGFLAQWKQRQNRNRWEKAMRDGERLREAMEEIDPILHKISTQGVDSLARDEKKRLQRVSEMKRKLHGTDLPLSDYYKNR